MDIPAIDRRKAQDIVRQVQTLLREHYLPGHPDLDLTQGVGGALVGIFARFAEIIITRLNRVPEKNLLAFMDLLGAAQLPPQPARAPLRFTLASGSAAARVPAGTQVAAPGADGPVIFETERELALTAARLAAVYVRDPADRYADCHALTDGDGPGCLAFVGDRPMEHLLYLGDNGLLGLPNLTGLAVTIAFAAPPENAIKLAWEAWDGAGWQALQPATDVYEAATRLIQFDKPPVAVPSRVDGTESRWLRVRLLNPLIRADNPPPPGVLCASELPAITSLRLTAAASLTDVAVEAAFANGLALDLSRDFYPFGERPKFQDTLYIAHRDAFAEAGAAITLDVVLTNPAGANAAPIPAVKADGQATLAWDYWDGTAWASVGTGSASATFSDGTSAFTCSGRISLTLPKPSPSLAVNGTESRWLRVRLVSGHYGQEARYVASSTPPGYTLIPASFAAPSIQSIRVGYHLSGSASPPERVKTYNDFAYQAVSSVPFTAFSPVQDARPTLYFGFDLPTGLASFPNRPLSLWLRVSKPDAGIQPASASLSARLVFEASTERGWTRLAVDDGTLSLSRSGLLEFLSPADSAVREEFGVSKHWLRLRWESGDYPFPPVLEAVLLNTTLAVQRESVSTETLGSGNGAKNQTFRAARPPVLAGQRLNVLEPEAPAGAERDVITREEGADAVSASPGIAGAWVRWHEVPDFHGSGPRSRHYVLDHLSGELRFGDGRGGMVPPAGAGNLRIHYQTGGGAAGNKAKGEIGQLLTTLPYVDKAFNVEAAVGGADAEQTTQMLDRVPRRIRHRDRAVTLEDYQDLAVEASADVARALCVPSRDLACDPLEQNPPVPGTVSVIIVPRSNSNKPVPSLELAACVQGYLAARSLPTLNLRVTPPMYLRVGVRVEIALARLEDAADVERRVFQALSSFLHPLSGGLDGKGWDFGREPHASDVYALLERLPGVDHINMLAVEESPDAADIDVETLKKAGHFLVYSGTHTLALVCETP